MATTSGTTTDTNEVGLRERKRAATAATIERAALDLTTRLGYERVTVEMICDASMVSPRTFFNYFGSKEGVILGAPSSGLSDQARAAFIHSANPDVLSELVELLAAALTDADPDPQILRSRRAIISAHPELLARRIDRMNQQEAEVVELVLERFAAQGRTTEQTPDLHEEARMVVAMVGGVLRFTMAEWYDDRSTATPRELFANALQLIHRIIR